MGIFSAALAGSYNSSGIVSSDWIPANLMGGGGYSRTKSGLAISEETALYHSAVFACQRAISESLAVLPRNIYRGDSEGTRIVEKSHPSLRLLKREANPLQSSYKFFETQERRAMASGNAYAELQFDKKDGSVVAAWPIPSHRVNPQLIEKSGTELDIIYRVTLPNGGEVVLPKDRVLHIPGIGFDGIRGYPLMDFMLHAVGLGQSLEEYSSLFFKQGAEIPGYVSVPDSFSEEQIGNLRKHYNIINEGLDNAHRLKFLYESAKFAPSGHSPADSQMVESKVFQIQEIARFHRMPLHKIQETSKATGYDSLEQFNIEFANDTLMPWIVNWEQEINRKFFEEDEGLYVKFNTNALLRGDSKSRALFYRTMVFTGIMTPNEARALEELPPIDGGDERMIPLNMTTDGQATDKGLDGKQRVQD